MRGFIVVLTLIGFAILFLPTAGSGDGGCTFDHTANGTDVYVCEELEHGDAVGLYYYWNDSIKVQNDSLKEYTYVHELGHAMGKDHTESGIMSPKRRINVDCRVSDFERSVARTYDTVSVGHRGSCSWLETPYGILF